MKTVKNRTCPLCESSALVERTRELSVHRNGRELIYSALDTVCRSCGAEMAFDEQTTANLQAIVAVERLHTDAPQPGAIAAWRAQWQLSQRDAGRMLRTGPTSFSKYENSVMLPSGPSIGFLNHLMESEESTIREAAKIGINLTPSPKVTYKAIDEPVVCMMGYEHKFGFEKGGVPCQVLTYVAQKHVEKPAIEPKI